MALGLENLKINKKARKKAKRVGRGNASGSGTYSGRGLKGQRSRSGGKGGLKRRGLMQMLKNKPKIGGFKSMRQAAVAIDLSVLDKFFGEDEKVDYKKLINKKIIKPSKGGLKILGSGKLSKKMHVVADNFSESAKKAIIKVGGKAETRKRK